MIFIRIYVYDIYIYIDSILGKVQIPFMQFARIPLLKYRWVVWWNSMVSRAHPHQLVNISCYPHVSRMKSCKCLEAPDLLWARSSGQQTCRWSVKDSCPNPEVSMSCGCLNILNISNMSKSCSVHHLVNGNQNPRTEECWWFGSISL